MVESDALVSLEQLKLLVESAPIGMFLTDSENRFTYTNPQWSEITGLAAEDVHGRLRSEIIETQVRGGRSSEPPEYSIDDSEMTYRVEMRLPGLAPRIVEVHSKSILGVDGPAGWVGTVADVTAEASADVATAEAREKAAEASQMKSDFLSNISHEVRTPMNGVIGMSDLLLDTDLDARQREFAHALRQSGQTLLLIVNEILDFSKLEVGKIAIEETNLDVRRILDDAVMSLATSAQKKGLDLVVSVARSVPDVVVGDPARLRQVLDNLVGNAIKFTQIGEVVVRVTSTIRNTEAEIKFEIADTGDGVPPHKLAVIFQPFVQADTSSSRRYGGAGLGLSISRELVSLMGGDCDVSSEPDVGSTFVFTIRTPVVKEASARAPVPHGGLSGVTALIVDDSTSQRGILARQLAEWGMFVSTARSGEAALALLRRASRRARPFDVALIDELMPEMDGHQVASAIRSDPTLNPRLVLMGGLSPDDGSRVPRRGGITSLSKPIRIDNLLASMLSALDLEPIVESGDSELSSRAAGKVPVSGRVLLVEDNVINQKVAAAMLAGAGYDVETVTDGSDAVQAVKDDQYDAILMDCQMPGLDGFEATAAIRALEGRGRHTPIIALTAGARPEDRERCLAEGMDGYLAKPLDRNSLLSIVAQFVEP
jgi:two-component system sensor histidine kinase/response regulator